MELFILPSVDTMNTQFGFKESRSTNLACSLLNDIMCYTKERNSPLYVCSLDAEKCFDRIWHNGLFYKLINFLPEAHWAFLYNLYSKLSAQVKWKDCVSSKFMVTRGTRQGSILSPTLFNIFINELLQRLACINTGVQIGGHKYNSLAYADDVSIFSLTTNGLQHLIDCCSQYAKEWRLSFGVQKSKCMVVGKPILRSEPKFYLGEHIMKIENTLDILGVTFNSNGSAETHVLNKISAARRAFYKAMSYGVAYPGLASDVKASLWKSLVAPVMVYGAETIPVTAKLLKSMDTAQAKQVKQFMGLSSRSHNTNLLQALNITKASTLVTNALQSLLRRSLHADSPYRQLVAYQLAGYIYGKRIPKGTLVTKIVDAGLNPLHIITSGQNTRPKAKANGIIDTLRFITNCAKYNVPGSFEHNFTKLLLRGF
jgi:hypothetical protein